MLISVKYIIELINNVYVNHHRYWPINTVLLEQIVNAGDMNDYKHGTFKVREARVSRNYDQYV